jgi:hypothetical protein
MSEDFEKIMHSLQSDFNMIVDFLDNSEKFISKYNINSREKLALMNRDFDALSEICGSSKLSAGILSGAHTPGCGNNSIWEG